MPPMRAAHMPRRSSAFVRPKDPPSMNQAPISISSAVRPTRRVYDARARLERMDGSIEELVGTLMVGLVGGMLIGVSSRRRDAAVRAARFTIAAVAGGVAVRLAAARARGHGGRPMLLGAAALCVPAAVTAEAAAGAGRRPRRARAR